MRRVFHKAASLCRKLLPCDKAAAALLCILAASAIFCANASAIGFDAEKTYDSVFVIYADLSLGSGFSIGKDLVITNAHVVSGADKITVVNYRGDEFIANISALDEELDIAALWIDNAGFPVLETSDYRECKVGEDVYAIGTPNSMDYTLTKGVLSAKDRRLGPNRYLQIDAPINSGNSGGPLLNDSGAVIGVNTIKITNSEGIGLAVPMTAVCDFLERSGIEIDQEGNVTGLAKEPYVPSKDMKPGKASNRAPGTGNREMNPQITLLVILLILSISANVLLVILLIFRKKAAMHKPASSERTDFEIDILE